MSVEVPVQERKVGRIEVVAPSDATLTDFNKDDRYTAYSMDAELADAMQGLIDPSTLEYGEVSPMHFTAEEKQLMEYASNNIQYNRILRDLDSAHYSYDNFVKNSGAMNDTQMMMWALDNNKDPYDFLVFANVINGAGEGAWDRLNSQVVQQFGDLPRTQEKYQNILRWYGDMSQERWNDNANGFKEWAFNYLDHTVSKTHRISSNHRNFIEEMALGGGVVTGSISAGRQALQSQLAAARQSSGNKVLQKVKQAINNATGTNTTVGKTVANNKYFTGKVEYQAPAKGTGYKYTVHQQKIDPDLVVEITNPRTGRKFTTTNRDLMEAGNAPYVMKNGKQSRIELHHSRQNAKGQLFEISDVTHRAKTGRGSEALHPYKTNRGRGLNGNGSGPRASQHPHYPVNRPSFNVDRTSYWQWRIKQF